MCNKFSQGYAYDSVDNWCELIGMFKACLALHRQVERLRKPVILGCWSCRLWISRRYCSFDPSRLSSFERHTDSQEQGFSSHSNPLSLYLQCVIWRPELFSFKKLGVLLAEHSDEVSSIPDEVFDAIEGRFPDLKKVLKRSHEFLGRAEYISFFSSIMGFLRKDMLQIFKKETNSKEQLDLILKYRREQGQLLDLPKFVRKRASVGNSLWDCSLLLSGYHIAASPCKNLKTAKSELYAKAVAQVFADFVKSIEKDFYSHQNKNNDGVLDKYLKSLIARKQPTKSDLNSITCLKTRLLKVIQKQYPNCSLQMFGSAVTGLWKPASDVDFVVLPNKTSQNTSCKTQKYLRVLTKILRSTGMFSVFLIGNAKVPIVKFVDNSSGLKGDVSLFVIFNTLAHTT